MSSSAPDSDRAPAGRRPWSRDRAPLALALAALLSSWNPLAAPFGLAVGLGAALLAGLDLRIGRGRRQTAAWGLALGAGAALLSLVVLWRSAGLVTTELPGEPVVERRSPARAAAVLDEAAARSAEARDRARRELQHAAGAAPAEAGAGTSRSVRSGKGLPAGAARPPGPSSDEFE